MSIFQNGDSSIRTRIYPNEYQQDSADSIVAKDGRYDFTRLSDGERKTILDVLSVAYSEKYTQKQKAIGFANEASTVKYKARHILHEVIVQRYRDSECPMDYLAVGFAYLTKGAIGRANALRYFEAYLSKAKASDKEEAGRILFDANDPFFSYKLAELYDQEGCPQQALRFALKAQELNLDNAPGFPLLVGKIYRKIDPLLSQQYLEQFAHSELYKKFAVLFLKEAEISAEWVNKSFVYQPKPYRPSKKVAQLESQISEAAKQFV